MHPYRKRQASKQASFLISFLHCLIHIEQVEFPPVPTKPTGHVKRAKPYHHIKSWRENIQKEDMGIVV